MVLLQPYPFLNKLTSMFEKSTEKGSVWVTLKRCRDEGPSTFSIIVCNYLKPHMMALKKRGRKDKKKAAETEKKVALKKKL